nr:UPF0149 family protein [Zooshikella harenae]
MQTKHLDSLSDDELNQISQLLGRFQHDKAMNLDMLDGFFVALHCNPHIVAPSEYLPEIWGGGDMPDDEAFDDEQQSNTFFSVVMSHWNNVGKRLSEDDIFFPVLFEEDTAGCDWARGFLRGMYFCYSEWSDFINNDKIGGAAVAIFMFANEHNPDPELRPFKEPITQEKREELLAMLSASVMKIYKHFAEERRFNARLAKEVGTIRRDSPKVGRNDPCPCGSGKKYKKCCALLIEH